MMMNLSLTLPEALAKASQREAAELGVSRVEFIRQAIVHEVERLEKERELQAIAQAMVAMKNNKSYQQEADSITDSLNTRLPNERKKEWWKK